MAFTLVELLVAMAIIMAVAALVVLFVDWRSKDTVTDGANQVLGWLSQARERALRDQRFVGLRLIPDANGLASSVIFLSQTEDWSSPGGQVTVQWSYTPSGGVQETQGWIVALGPQTSGQFTLSYNSPPTSPLAYNATAAQVETALEALASVGAGNAPTTGPNGGPYTIAFAKAVTPQQLTADFSALGTPATGAVVGPYSNYTASGTDSSSNPLNFWGGFGATQNALWPIQPGDYLELNSGGTFAQQIFQITAVNQTTLGMMGFFSATDPGNSSSSTFKIVRQARVYPGEPPLQLPANIIIDVNAVNSAYPWYNLPLPASNAAPGAYDILFSPSGPVAPNSASQPILYLWLRDTRDDNPANSCMFGPHQRVVAIYTRTGAFSSLQVDTTLDPNTPPMTGYKPRYADPFTFAQYGQ